MVPIVMQAIPGNCEGFLLVVVCNLFPFGQPAHTTPNFEEVEVGSLTLAFGVTEPLGGAGGRVG